MADFQKPSQCAAAYQTVFATPVEAVVYVEDVSPGRNQLRQPSTTEQGIMIGAWSTDFWGCCDAMVPNCLMVTFCPCVSLAQISERLNVAPYRCVLAFFLVVILAEIFTALSSSSSSSEATWYRATSTEESDPNYEEDDEKDEDSHSLANWIHIILRVVVIAYVWHLRQTTRRMFKIPGGACGDCWASFCCSCCTMAQIATHIKSYQPGACSFGPPNVLPSYPAPQTPQTPQTPS